MKSVKTRLNDGRIFHTIQKMHIFHEKTMSLSIDIIVHCDIIVECIKCIRKITGEEYVGEK